MGRYTLIRARKGAEIIGLDLSNAIEAAYAKSRHLPTFHAIQGDIYNLPFRDSDVHLFAINTIGGIVDKPVFD